MSKMTEYRRLVNEAKKDCTNARFSELDIRLHSLERLFIVSETTAQGTTSMVFTVRKEAECYRGRLVKITEQVGRTARIKFRVAYFEDESESRR